MDNPVSSASAGIRSAFSFRLFLQFLALTFLFYAVMGLGLRFLPQVFGPLYRLVTNPLSFIPDSANQG